MKKKMSIYCFGNDIRLNNLGVVRSESWPSLRQQKEGLVGWREGWRSDRKKGSGEQVCRTEEKNKQDKNISGFRFLVN